MDISTSGLWIVSLIVVVCCRLAFVSAETAARKWLWSHLWARRSQRQRALGCASILFPLLWWTYTYRAIVVQHARAHMNVELPKLYQYYFGPVLDIDPTLPTRRLLVVGEVGDGKSTLINALRDPALSHSKADAGRGARGITKKIRSYAGLPINGQRIELIDTPGVGDMDITPTKLISLLEAELGSHNKSIQIDGLLVTSPVPDGRVKLGAQVVRRIVEKGFLGDSKWASIILVGTKNDRAEDEAQREFFRTEIMQSFFSLAPKQRGAVALVSRDDYSELQREVTRLPRLKCAAPARPVGGSAGWKGTRRALRWLC